MKQRSRKKSPSIFISYCDEEFFLAEFVADVIKKHYGGQVGVFLAKKGIRSGKDPLKVILKENLLEARSLIAICSEKSRLSGWVWWESASVWTSGGAVHPLFVGIKPGEFGSPMALLNQGRDYLKKSELKEALAQAVQDAGIRTSSFDFTSKEVYRLNRIKQKFKKYVAEQLKEDKSLLESFKTFMSTKLRQADALVKDSTLNKPQVLKWKNQVFGGIRVALGSTIQNKDARHNYHQVESEAPLLILYDFSPEQLQRRLGEWRRYMERFRNSIFPDDLSTQFSPRDLKEYEKI